MSRSSRRNRKSQRDNHEEMEVDSGSEDVVRNMSEMNVSQNAQRSRHRIRLLEDSDSEEELPVPQRMNGSRKVQKAKKGKARQVESESDEELQPSTSQASQKRKKNNASSSQSQRPHKSLSQASTSRAGETFNGEEMSASQVSPNTSLTEQEYSHHVANVVKYILAANHSNQPIDRIPISKAVNCHNKKFKDVFADARKALEDVFGYRLEELEDENKSDPKNPGKQVKSSTSKYILVNIVNYEDEVLKNLCDDFDEETSRHYVLLFLCLAHIFMSGDKCNEDSLFTFLKKLEIVTGNHARHDEFGDAMEVVKKVFTKEKYINYDDKENEFSWGVRAVKELKPRTVMEFMSEIYDDRTIQSWPQEYERLLVKEEEQNQRPNGR